MVITLITQKKYLSMNLPERCSGKYWLSDDEKKIGRQQLLSIEADEASQVWKVNSSPFVHLFKENIEIEELILEPDKIYPILLGKNDKVKAFIFTEAFTEARCSYTTYMVKENSRFKIGYAKDNDIIIDNYFVSKHHAVLSYTDGLWRLDEDKNTNGIYVNRTRVTGGVSLKAGDVIFIFGFKIIIGSNFISINNPAERITVATKAMQKFEKKQQIDEEIYIPEEKDYYYRSPNFKRNITKLELKVDMPSQQGEIEDTPIMLTLAPSMIMGVAAFSSGIFSFINTMNNNGNLLSSLPTMVMAVAMLIGMIIFPVIMRKRERKRKIEKEVLRHNKYIKYLSNIKSEIKNNRLIQENILRENNMPVLECVDNNEFWKGKLWNRTDTSTDFLSIRIGLGNENMYEDIKFPEERFSIEDDYLRNELTGLQKADKILLDVPICVSLLDNKVVGIVGERTGMYNLVNNILLQIFLLHGYDEVKLVCIYEPKDEEQLSYVRVSKHVWDNENQVRFLATTEADVRELSTYLKNVYDEYRQLGERNIVPQHYIILSAGKYLANKCEFISNVLSDRSVKGFSMICAYDRKESLPKECSAIIEVNGSQGIFYRKDATDSKRKGFVQDEINTLKTYRIVQKLSTYALDLNQGRYNLPDRMTFMDMFGVGKCEHLNVRQRWKENNPVKSLKTAIGVDTNGETFYLDLHERYHGPHGLVAGMTGSGKSELIITYILSMAINYHPDEVAFVLIDYKGGGLAGAFDNEKYTLPHLAGTITNLDGNAITRAIYSVRSELIRRQKIFNRAREIANEGTMDIYKYQKMYREHIVSEPMPHLIIIADEFAELKTQQSEFLEQLISTARIGRSLGVHLILATQKPSGVVNEQIWANSKFKVCLKVQDRSDSMDMLKKPDAASITETGRFYLQVGYDELFELGQSAWSGAPYTDSDKIGSEADDTIEIIDNTGNITEKIRKENTVKEIYHGRQIVCIMEYLSQIAEEDNIRRKTLWLPEILAVIMLEDIKKKYGWVCADKASLVGIIGELDNPYEQSKELLTINFTTEGNAIIYGAADSGEDMMLNAILYSLYEQYNASELNTYIFDFGSEALKAFEAAPQTGGVVLDGEDERIDNFFHLISKEMKNRKKKLLDYAGSFDCYNNTSGERLPYILIIINNYSNFNDSYEQYEEAVTVLMREGLRYGICFLVTAASASAVRYRMIQNFRQVFCLKLNDRTEYTAAVGNTGGVYPNGIAGRGVIKRKESYIFQTAHIAGEQANLQHFIMEFCAGLSSNSKDKAVQIPLVPKIITVKEFEGEEGLVDRVPVGISLDNYEKIYVNIREKNILHVMSQVADDAHRYACGLAELLTRQFEAELIAINVNGQAEEYLEADASIMNMGDSKVVERLYDRLVDRNNGYKTNGELPENDNHTLIILINEFGRILGRMSSNDAVKIKTCLEWVEGICNVYFVLSDSYQGVGKYSSDTWYTGRIAGEGVWVGNGIGDQMRLHISKKSKQLRRNIDDYTGYLVQKGEAKLMRLIMPDKVREERECLIKY